MISHHRSAIEMAEHELGTHMGPSMLEEAWPFDREFTDMMIAHHQRAIRMARVQLENGESSELKRLSRSVIEAQAGEIDQMNVWRADWYGALSPAGGVPPDTDQDAPAEGEDGHHSG
jgi:uncharacterized protein (DUF305 family)